MQAFKDAETCGAYIGFIAGILSANPSRAENLMSKMISIDPADHWVLVRAVAYSGLPHWREILSTFADRMPMRRAMVDKYLDGELPTLEQIDYAPKMPGVMDKMKAALHLTDTNAKKPVTLTPSPELIDVLWGFYLATGTYAPIGRIVKLLPLSNDHDSVDNLTTGSAAKFTLASNAVRDLQLLSMLKWAAKHQPENVTPVLKGVVETAETVDTVRMRKESLAAIDELKQKGPDFQARALRLGPGRPGRPVDGLRRCRGNRANRTGHPLRTRRRRLLGRDAIRVALSQTVRICSYFRLVYESRTFSQ